MSKKVIKTILLILCAIFIVSGTILCASANLGLRKNYENIDEITFSEKLSGMTTSELFKEINILSAEGVSYENLIDFAFVLLERIDSIPENLLISSICDETNNVNLRMLCVELLEQKCVNESGFVELSDKSALKLSSIVLNDEENISIRRRLIETLPRNDATADILESISYDDDDTVAYRALQFLNFFAPERSRPIAIDYIRSGENIATGIDIINYQMRHSNNSKEKDAWVEYLVGLLEASNEIADDKQQKMNSTNDSVIYSLNAMHYYKALYAIIDSEYVDDEYKKYCIGDPYSGVPLLLEILEKTPTPYDIEMIGKAICLNPKDTSDLIEPFKIAVQEMNIDYDIGRLIK